MIIEYEIFQSIDINQMVGFVNKRIEKGWQPLSDICVVQGWIDRENRLIYYQAISRQYIQRESRLHNAIQFDCKPKIRGFFRVINPRQLQLDK